MEETRSYRGSSSDGTWGISLAIPSDPRALRDSWKVAPELRARQCDQRPPAVDHAEGLELRGKSGVDNKANVMHYV